MSRGVSWLVAWGLFCLAFAPALADGADENPYRTDARALLDLISHNYAYLDRFEGANPALTAQGVNLDEVTDAASLLDFAECALFALKDHHAIMGVNAARSYGLTPSHADLWVEDIDGRLVITDVRRGSPAAAAGVQPGSELLEIEGLPAEDAIGRLCGGPYATSQDRGFAARVLAAGRRDRPRQLVILDAHGVQASVELAPFSAPQGREPIDAWRAGTGALVLRFNDSLGADGLAGHIDDALEHADAAGVILDLRDTPGGGNSLNARALLGRFLSETRPYQRHELVREARETGIVRLWVEEAAPRAPALAHVPVVVLVGRWTGSMGEGIAIGFDHAAGAPVMGSRMAGLRGAVYDFVLPHTGWAVKLPAERLSHVDGAPREAYAPSIQLDTSETLDGQGEDIALNRALEVLSAMQGRAP
ncbi:hypothetical protein F1654_03070 [Alkalicaulis satelles]|uniref:Tail specific protease domain-containing protein n=1 Tax=Alkalicaulis satelles TaxID=2609175 RepID=A0A5M6ZJJ8_9PROT|nr:S41 family peptidase [Alkalicaulis satelles]KAA5804992.1 hypothetical protein F1654_03070 [Alkalicaulis satelles]